MARVSFFGRSAEGMFFQKMCFVTFFCLPASPGKAVHDPHLLRCACAVGVGHFFRRISCKSLHHFGDEFLLFFSCEVLFVNSLVGGIRWAIWFWSADSTVHDESLYFDPATSNTLLSRALTPLINACMTSQWRHLGVDLWPITAFICIIALRVMCQPAWVSDVTKVIV